MNDARYKKLLKELQKLEKAVAKDLLAKCREAGPVGDRMVQRHAAAEVGGVPDDWFPIAAGRAAVQFLLRTVYVRVLEDLGLLEPHRIRGQRGYQAFRELAPNLGRQAYFRWIFRDLARDFPALFELGPDEPGMPSEELCETLWELWHKEDGKGGLFYDFTPAEGETFDGRFLGDLYQDLDADVRKRYALLQTPEFVESYILDYTLDPAMEKFDPAELRAQGECFRMLDPTCGSGHFLIGGFKRLFRYWTEREPDVPVLERVQRALDSVWGCDINDYAVAVARFRLLLAAHKAAGGPAGRGSVGDLASLQVNLLTLDSLVPWEGLSGQQELSSGERSRLLASYATNAERVQNGEFLRTGYHAVVGNPPYIVPRDAAKRDAYRAFWPDSCYMQYALSAPFVERFWDLGVAGSWIGLIVSNSFMKRSFGRGLVEKVFPRINLNRVVDTRGAFIPGHGTPTVILFGTGGLPGKSEEVDAVLGLRGEPSKPEVPEHGLVWSAIEQNTASVGFENEFIAVERIPRASLCEHPWSLSGGTAGTLLRRLDESALKIGDIIGRVGMLTTTRMDPVYFDVPPAVARDQVARQLGPHRIPIVEGVQVRDYGIQDAPGALFPYEPDGATAVDLPRQTPTFQHFWRHREGLLRRASIGFKSVKQRGMRFYEIASNYPVSYVGLKAVMAFVSTHNHIVLDRGGKVCKQSAPAIKLPTGASEQDYLAFLGFANTSVLAFWTRQNFHGKGIRGEGGGITAEQWEQFYEYDGTKLKGGPVPGCGRSVRTSLAAELDRLAASRNTWMPARLVGSQGIVAEEIARLAEGV